MSDQPNGSPPLPITADFMHPPTDALRETLAPAIREIEDAGVRVTGIHFTAPDAPPRFYIQFISDEPQWQVRTRLEAKLYDVGSKIGATTLTFYAVKRIEQTKGWQT